MQWTWALCRKATTSDVTRMLFLDKCSAKVKRTCRACWKRNWPAAVRADTRTAAVDAVLAGWRTDGRLPAAFRNYFPERCPLSSVAVYCERLDWFCTHQSFQN